MPKWTDYTTKTTVADNDEIMTLDTAGKANKRLSLSTLSDWVLGKIADKVFEKLQTNDKTILGAINELNSNTMKHVSANSDITPLIDSAKRFNRKLISFDAYDIPDFFPSSSNWWMGFIALNNSGTYGTMIAFSFSDNVIYKCCWNGSTDKILSLFPFNSLKNGKLS